LGHLLHLAWAKFHKVVVGIKPFINEREAN
jgi:hypothetical protein